MEKEPTLLDYARFHGLAIPLTNFDPLSEFLAAHPPQISLDDPPGCQPTSTLLNPALVQSLTREKIVVNRNVAELIARCIKPPKHPPWSLFDDYRRIRDLKVELPLLSTDPELDVEQFLSQAKSPVPNLGGLQPIVVDEENDEGLSWPRKYFDAGDHLNKIVKKEKLDTTREALAGLRRLLERPVDPEIERHVIKDDLHYRKNDALQPLTPLLMPIEEPKEPFVPSSPALLLELAPDKSDPALPSKQQLDRKISQEDQITVNDCGDADTKKVKELLKLAQEPPKLPEWSNLWQENSSSRKCAIGRSKEDLKLETILFPVLESPSQPETSPEANVAQLLSETIPFSPSDDLRVDKLEDLLDDENLGQVARLALEKINTEIAHEPIDRVDVLGRVNVPTLDPIKTEPPWKLDIASQYPPMLADLRNKSKHDQQRIQDEVEPSLCWVPFPSKLAKVHFHETISGCEKSAIQLLKIPKDIMESKNFLQKNAARLFLKCDNGMDDEYLKECMNLTAKAPALRVTASKLSGKDLTVDTPQNEVKSTNLLKRPVPQTFMANLDGASNAPTLSASGSCGVTDPLACFLQTRSSKFRKLDHTTSAYFTQVEPEHPQERLPSQPEVLVPATPIPTPKPLPNIPLNTPQYPAGVCLTAPRTLILNTALLKTYSSLINRLETHSPHPPQLIFHDLSDLPSGRSPAEHVVPDIVLSPTTALIIIPLQSVVQRSLPGQGSSIPPTQARILSLARQFPTLFILATYKTDAGNLDGAAMSSLTTLQTLCASLGTESEVSVILIPPMTTTIQGPLAHAHRALIDSAKSHLNHHLLNWILKLVEKYGFQFDPETVGIEGAFTEEETSWQIFLQHTGLNPFAAMAVLSILEKEIADYNQLVHARKRIRRTLPGTTEARGLPRLIQMSQPERVALFEDAIGRKAVETMGKILDFEWGMPDFGNGDAGVENWDYGVGAGERDDSMGD
ncbi:MAG: hypothetical protein Q9160_000565 [Pyrenula sp. 1 TL-2023]